MKEGMMALSATTEKARLCHSTSSSKVICSQAVGTQLSKLCAPLQNRQERVLTCLLRTKGRLAEGCAIWRMYTIHRLDPERRRRSRGVNVRSPSKFRLNVRLQPCSDQLTKGSVCYSRPPLHKACQVRKFRLFLCLDELV